MRDTRPGRHKRRTSRQSERGFALLLALSGLAFLSFVAAATISDTRHAARLAAARAGEIEAAALAEAGIARGILAIDEDWTPEAWPENGAPVRFAFGHGVIAVAVQDEAGKLDLCAAPDLMAEAVLEHAGMAPERRRAILDGLRKARARAALARRAFAPASLEELAASIGLGPEEIEALRPLITVHSGLGGFDEIVGPPALAALIPGLGASASVSRTGGPARADMAGRPPSPSPAFTVTSPRHMFTLRAEACTAGGHWAAREALIERRGPGDITRIEMREPIAPVLRTSCRVAASDTGS